jgi:valyl-tRNA synthetase
VSKPSLAATSVIEGIEAFVPLQDVIDLGAERERLRKELTKAEAQLGRIAQKLRNEDFVRKAPPAVVQSEQGKLDEFTVLCDKLKAQLGHLESLEG